MEFTAATNIGKVREINEDAYLAEENLVAVADGMGGHNAGEIASTMALDVFRQSFGSPPPDSPAPVIEESLGAAVAAANKAVHVAAAKKKAYSGMGTTLTAAYVAGGRLFLAHVGDSRAFLLSDGSVAQISIDHTLVNEMIGRGEIDDELASIHPLRHVITRALGTFDSVLVDISSRPVKPGDIIVVCSDGLAAKVPATQIAKTVESSDSLQAAAGILIDMALAAGGEDNITLVAARVLEADCV